MVNRIKTQTAAKILGVSPATVVEHMRTGRYPIGDYYKNGKRATVKIYTGMLADYLKRPVSDIEEAVTAIECGGDGDTNG